MNTVRKEIREYLDLILDEMKKMRSESENKEQLKRLNLEVERTEEMLSLFDDAEENLEQLKKENQ